MFIIAVDTVNPETLLVEIPEDKAASILASFNNDYLRLLQSIDIIDKKLIMMRPKVISSQLIVSRSRRSCQKSPSAVNPSVS